MEHTADIFNAPEKNWGVSTGSLKDIDSTFCKY